MIDKRTLYDEYITKEKPMKQISEEYNIAVGTIYNYIKKYQIPSRQRQTKLLIEKMRESKKGKSSSFKGKHHTKETIEKIRISHIGKFKIKTKYGGHKKKKNRWLYCNIYS